MKTEVEMKAWVDDPARLRRVLDERCEFQREFVKEDIYFRGLSIGDLPGQELRVRRDDGVGVCTFKDRSVVDGLEINQEHEFPIADPETFVTLVDRLGARVFVEKRKQGRAYRYGELTVELHEVAGLGHFVEVEAILDDAVPERIEASRRSIADFLSSVGVSAARIESRPYTAMLKAKADGNAVGPPAGEGSAF